MADDEVDITLTAEPPLDGSFPPLASTAPLNTFDDGDDDFSIPEKEALKLELSQTLGLTHTDRDLVSVDDTGMYNLVAQLSKKVIDLTEQVNNPPWFDKVKETLTERKKETSRYNTEHHMTNPHPQ